MLGDSVLSSRARTDIQQAYSTDDVLNFNPTVVFIATWSNVTFDGPKNVLAVSTNIYKLVLNSFNFLL